MKNKREIKFRCWDTLQKKMVYGVGFFPTGEVMFPIEYGAEINNETAPKFIEAAAGKKFDEILMQWTGLLDKSGKEIYEGDIVKLKNGDAESVGSVRFDKFYEMIIEIKRWLNERGGGNVEVIGNIYETPELLK